MPNWNDSCNCLENNRRRERDFDEECSCLTFPECDNSGTIICPRAHTRQRYELSTCYNPFTQNCD